MRRAGRFGGCRSLVPALRVKELHGRKRVLCHVSPTETRCTRWGGAEQVGAYALGPIGGRLIEVFVCCTQLGVCSIFFDFCSINLHAVFPNVSAQVREPSAPLQLSTPPTALSGSTLANTEFLVFGALRCLKVACLCVDCN